MNISKETVRTLLATAKTMSERAYAPYSSFHVGAALLDEDGGIYGGCNVECSSFGGTICAERSALCQAIAAGKRRFTAILIYTPTATPTPPCGICRQMLMDFNPEMTVILVDQQETMVRRKLKTLLPLAFTDFQVPAKKRR